MANNYYTPPRVPQPTFLSLLTRPVRLFLLRWTSLQILSFLTRCHSFFSLSARPVLFSHPFETLPPIHIPDSLPAVWICYSLFYSFPHRWIGATVSRFQQPLPAWHKSVSLSWVLFFSLRFFLPTLVHTVSWVVLYSSVPEHPPSTSRHRFVHAKIPPPQSWSQLCEVGKWSRWQLEGTFPPLTVLDEPPPPLFSKLSECWTLEFFTFCGFPPYKCFFPPFTNRQFSFTDDANFLVPYASAYHLFLPIKN